MKHRALRCIAALHVMTLTGLTASCGTTDASNAGDQKVSEIEAGHAQTTPSVPAKGDEKGKPDAIPVYGAFVEVIRVPFVVGIYALGVLGCAMYGCGA